MELNRIGNFTILKVIQTGPHQPDARYGASWGIHFSCMSLMSISWTLIKDELFKSIDEFR